jgi:type IV pilus assembly protein PilY1
MRTKAALLVSLLVVPAGARAEDPDLRDIRPVVMLLVDTSGSMERMAGSDDLPMCTGSSVTTNQRNRWTTMLEALTGSWPAADYYCTSVARSGGIFTDAPDAGYFLPYHQPPIALAQNNDGVLDVYLDRVKFGLMTFDPVYTFTDSHPLLVPQTEFEARLAANAGALGSWSYGEPRPLTYPGCATTFMVDTGARNDAAGNGALVSAGNGTSDPLVVNATIQSTLLDTRPSGGTPTAGLLHDARTYLSTNADVNADDPFASCRPRYVVLLTDGPPDEEFRDARFDCEGTDGCPYDRASVIANDLCQYSGASEGCTGEADGVYVIGFGVTDEDALAELDAIADLGGTEEAIRASSREELLAALSQVLDRAQPGSTTRTRAAFVTGASTFTDGPASQLEFNAGFTVGSDSTPWTGILERTQYVCDGLTPVPEAPEDRLRFDLILNARSSSRNLYTVVADADEITGNLIGTSADAVPLGATAPEGAVTGLELVAFDNSNVTADHLGLTNGSQADRDAERDRIVDWVHGVTADREDARMGDIYHSHPVAVGPPLLDIADESYNLFRQRPEVAGRPTVVYVGTNDGVLHAFAAEDWNDPESGRSLDAGEEIWGFVPPILLPKLQAATVSHQAMVDGTPVVRDIYFKRLPSDAPSGDIYHTVLVMGLRDGGAGYFSLDVTDPLSPEFLWQYVGDESGSNGNGGNGNGNGGGGGGGGRNETPFGYTWARPAIGQVLVEVDGVLQERAIALLPGGSGTIDEDQARTTGPVGCPAQGRGEPPDNDGVRNARENMRCWDNTGRVLSWIDIVTGEVISLFDENTFDAPLTGGVALYPGDTGEIAQRAFLTDADGVMWAVDFSARRPADWSVRRFWDIFLGAGATEGQPAYDPPVVSVDLEGNLVVLVGTGDIDALESTAENRVVSLTELRTFSSSGVPSYETELNWEIGLQAGEQVTGQIELFNGRAYFGTFESSSGSGNACALGESRIWAVDYRTTGSVASGYGNDSGRFPSAGFESVSGTGTFDTHFRGPFADQLVLGVGITQRPTCVQGSEEIDPYIGRRFRASDVGGGQFELTAQVSGGTRSGTNGGIVTLNLELPAPRTFTRVQGFAGRVDY